jgi:hypothetical protein
MGNMNVADTIRTIVDDGSLLAVAEMYLDDDLGGQCVGIRLAFADREIFIHAEGADDTICVSSGLPATLLDESIRRTPMPAEWASALGRPILWAWTMTNTQGRVDGVQIEFGTIDHPSITLQLVVRASTLVMRLL